MSIMKFSHSQVVLVHKSITLPQAMKAELYDWAVVKELNLSYQNMDM